MPVPHFNIKITQRSKGNSAVAGAAYQAGEKLFSEYDQKTKNYTCKKEVVYTEIMLPPNAPPEYADRATLWNSVEEIEKQWNSQLARRFVAALPREVPMELLPQMVKEYCEEQFVSKGMCCDFAIHDPDPPGHNPHCHFMLTMRAIDENGKWMPKSRKVYDLDENGERIKLPSGRWKSHKEDVTALHSHHLDVIGDHLIGLGTGRRSAGHYRASQTLTGNSDDDFAGLPYLLTGVGLFSSGEAHHRRIEGEVRHKANGSQVRRTILLFRADQCQRIGGGQNSSLHNVQFFHVIQTFLRNFSR